MKYNCEINMSKENSHSLILQHISRESDVLEFGSATGYMTRFMKEELGCSVYCIEIDRDAAQEAEKYCKQMIIEDIENLNWGKQLKGQRFDHILFADVLEHLKNPREILSLAVGFLKKNGTIITSIPNIAHNAIIMELMQDKFGYRPLGILDESHLRFFTKNGILELLDYAGLVPVEWLGTVAYPEHTEFEQSYSNFPWLLQGVLKARDNGHVYQFITISKRKEDTDCKLPKNYLIDNKLEDSYLQVFWEEENGYSEQCSVKVPLIYDGGFKKYSLLLPPRISSSVRLDPGNEPAYIEIKSLALLTGANQGNIIKQWSASEEILAGQGIINLGQESAFQFVTIDNDPQLLLTQIIPRQFAESPVLQIELYATRQIPDNIMDRVKHQICRKTSIILELKGALKESDILIKGHLAEIARMEEAIKGKDGQIKLQEDKLLIVQKHVDELDLQLIDKGKQIMDLTECLTEIQLKVADKEEQIKLLTDEILHLKAKLTFVDNQLQQVLQSYSWRLTSPLRWVRKSIKK